MTTADESTLRGMIQSLCPLPILADWLEENDLESPAVALRTYGLDQSSRGHGVGYGSGDGVGYGNGNYLLPTGRIDMWRAKPGAWYLVLRTEGGRDWVYLARFLEPNGHAGGVFSEAYSVFGLHNRVKFCSGEERNPDVYAKLPGELILDHGQLWEAKAP